MRPMKRRVSTAIYTVPSRTRCGSIRDRRDFLFRGNIMKTGKASAARHRFLAWVVLLPVLLGLRATAFGATDQTIYDETLAAGWQNWSWASVDLASTANANTGAVSIAVTA